MFSCIKDAEHSLLRNYATINIESITYLTASSVKFSASISNYGSEVIIDHGFILEGKTDTRISLGKLDQSGQFTCEVNDIVIGRKYLVKAYIKTNKYVIYSKVEIFESPLSASWNKINLTDRIQFGRFFNVNNKVYIYYNKNIAELKADYHLYNQQVCPDYLWESFVIDDAVYFFNINRNIIWRYNTVTITWTACETNFPDINYVSIFSFTQNDRYYTLFFSNYLQESYIFEFDPNTYVWTQRNKCEIDVFKNPNMFYYKNKAYVYCTNELWYFNEDLATFQLKSNIDIGLNWIYPIVTLNDRVYMISRNENIIDLFICDPENNTVKKICTLHDYFSDSFAHVVVINDKIVFIPNGVTYIYELDISKFE